MSLPRFGLFRFSVLKKREGRAVSPSLGNDILSLANGSCLMELSVVGKFSCLAAWQNKSASTSRTQLVYRSVRLSVRPSVRSSSRLKKWGHVKNLPPSTAQFGS